MIVIVCPGQGSQTPGFMSPWLEIPAFRESIQAMQVASGIDLTTHGTLSDADTMRDTAVAQPLIVAAGIASLAAVSKGKTLVELGVAGVAGHSVGEITAAVAAGVLTETEGIQFVAHRGKAMAEAAALESSSMAAVVGGEQEAVLARLNELGLYPANFNGGSQIVAAGTAQAIATLQAEGPAGARVIPLQVAGAFHTRFMQPAVASLKNFSGSISPSTPAVKLWSNEQGQLITDGNDYINLLVSQVSNPVRWDKCMDSMVSAGVTALIELCPAGTLTGLAKRSMPGIETLAVKTPENIDAALSLINNHSQQN